MAIGRTNRHGRYVAVYLFGTFYVYRRDGRHDARIYPPKKGNGLFYWSHGNSICHWIAYSKIDDPYGMVANAIFYPHTSGQY